MKQLEFKLGDVILIPTIIDSISMSVSILYLKGLETTIYKRDDISTREKEIYHNMVENKIKAIQDYGRR